MILEYSFFGRLFRMRLWISLPLGGRGVSGRTEFLANSAPLRSENAVDLSQGTDALWARRKDARKDYLSILLLLQKLCALPHFYDVPMGQTEVCHDASITSNARQIFQKSGTTMSPALQRETSLALKSLIGLFDELSIQPETQYLCPRCGNAMELADATFWIYGTNTEWRVRVPTCRCQNKRDS